MSIFTKLAKEVGELSDDAVRALRRVLPKNATVAQAKDAYERIMRQAPEEIDFSVTPAASRQRKVPAAPRTEAGDLTVTAPKRKAKKSLAVKEARPGNPVSAITTEYGGDVARRVRYYIEPDAPLAEWREMAERFAAADPSNRALRAPSPFSVRPVDVASDPRIEKRKGEMGKVKALEMEVAPRAMDPINEVSIFDYEGYPYITSMADLSAAGDDIISINGVPFRVPFSRRGGQDWMFDNPGDVWASDLKPAREHIALAERMRNETGKDVLFMPWTMGPLSVKFSHQPRGIQYSFADAAMEGADRRALEEEIRRILPGWRSFEDPESTNMFMTAAGKKRGALNTLMDRFRTRGGLGMGEAIYASTDLSQIGTPMTSLRNVGIIDPRFSVSPSSHASYRFSVPGEGRGRLRETNLGALSLDPALMEAYGYNSPFDFPVGVNKGVKSPMRSYQMKPQSGIITEDALRLIERLQDEGIVGR